MKALVIRNTVDLFSAVDPTLEILFEEVKEPVVLIMENGQVVDSFKIVARTHEEVDLMIKHKLFYTDSLSHEECPRQIAGTIFSGATYEMVYG